MLEKNLTETGQVFSLVATAGIEYSIYYVGRNKY